MVTKRNSKSAKKSTAKKSTAKKLLTQTKKTEKEIAGILLELHSELKQFERLNRNLEKATKLKLLDAEQKRSLKRLLK